MNEQVGPSLKFDQGTLLISGFTQAAIEKIFPGVPWQFDSRVGQFRTDARWYGEVSTQLHRVAGQVENDVQRWQKVAWSKVCIPELRKQQSEALDALNANGYCGLVVMPTGTGKTVVALEAARRLAISTLFVAPIRDLMYQWHRRIQELLGYDAGIIGDNTFNVRAISVTTYDSATIHMHTLGNRFGLLVFDECHHLPGDFYRDAALMSTAPHRIGLTATPERADGKHQLLSQLIGKTVYELKLSEATGSLLADYRVVRIPVSLSTVEQARYDQLSEQIRSYVYDRRQKDNEFTWEKLCQESNLDASARAVMKAFRQKIAIENRAKRSCACSKICFACTSASQRLFLLAPTPWLAKFHCDS